MFYVGRCVAGFAIVVAGTCTTAMNWRFSYQLGITEWDSYTWAIFSVALDVSKWLMLPCAALAWSQHKLRALAAVGIWLIATIYSFSAAIGFAAMNRDLTTSERQQQAKLLKDLETMKLSRRWQSSAACADATSPQSKEFCANYRAMAAQLKIPSQEPDPQSALFAKMTGLDIGTVRIALSIFLAAACEIISALGFFAILSPGRENDVQPQRPTRRWRAPAWRGITSPDPSRHVTTRPDAPRRGGWKRETPGS